MSTVISVEHLSKSYRLGMIGGGTLGEDISRWWARVRGQADPTSKIGDELHARHMGQEFWALQDVSFEVKDGEILGIIGRNGAGKSTLLKILSRVTGPTSGCVKIKGRIASLLEVGTGFHPELTGRENIFLNGTILGMTKFEIRKKFDEIVAFAEIDEFIDTPVKRYSSGMYVRLAFAVAAHLEPEILIVDEVLAVGDAQFQKKCLGKMKDVSQQGRTVLFVSHQLSSVVSLTTRCAYLVNGTVGCIGQTGEVVSAYMGIEQDKNFKYLNPHSLTANLPQIYSVELNTSLPGNVQVNNAPLEILVKMHTPWPIKGACLAVQIFDSEQVNFINLWTQDFDLPALRQAGMHLMRCTIPQFRLYMGNYRLRIYLSEPPGGKFFQILEGVCPFEVIMGNSSRLYPPVPKEGAYSEDYQWHSKYLEGGNTD